MIYVFLKNRSTSESFEAKKNKIEELLKKGDITPLYITDSTKKSKKFRDLLVSCCEGDIIYVNNLSEISYNISIVFKCIKNAILKKVSIISINGTINEKTFEDINLLGFLEVASEICASVDSSKRANLINKRGRKRVGRPKGSRKKQPNAKIIKHKNEIERLLVAKFSIVKIAKVVGIHRTTLSRHIDEGIISVPAKPKIPKPKKQKIKK